MGKRIGFFLIGVLVLAGCNLSSDTPENTPPDSLPTLQTIMTCDELVTSALSTVGAACDGLNRNEACYGHRLVNTVMNAGVTTPFDSSGDIAQLTAFQSIITTPLDDIQQTWGIAVLKAQANLPDTLPGENVTFLLIGDAELRGVSPHMDAVTLRTGAGGTTCTAAPPAALLLQTPSDVQATLFFNGASVTLGSTLFLSAAENGELTIATLEGTAIVGAFDSIRTVHAGMQVQLPLGTSDGLQVVGPPSEPKPLAIAGLERLPLALLERPISLPPSIPVIATSPPIGSTLVTAVPPSVILPPATPITPCLPRQDWTNTYTVQRGDTLFNIATQFDVTLSTLQEANCIENPNIISVGQALRVPFPPATDTPVPTATPFTTPTPTNPNLRADKSVIEVQTCTSIRWDVDNIRAVYFENEPVTGHDSREVCPVRATTYTLMVIWPGGEQVPYTITIDVTEATPDPASR
ncbi:MAG: LysM peptidoglycan-binding domain-containing protein [Anaerolineaceae bacterium]|nr:LysM peptidoglycan-binding domain-containing protein [Anaerolineaceae bacterium]